MSPAVLFCLCIISWGAMFSDVHAYTVEGNKIYDPNGVQVTLRGVDRPSLEWSITGVLLSLSDFTLMKAWGANVVRMPLNQDYWFESTAYQALVAQQATWIKSLSMGVIFDLHWNNGGQQEMADLNSITFWTQFSKVFINDPWIMFELYNEPHDIPWSVWLNGDGVNFAGMQQLYNAVRATGADNVVVVGGLNYAFDLSGVSAGYAVTGSNISYASHPYDYAGKQIADWDAAFGDLSITFPVILTEFGQNCNNDTYVSDLLAYAQINNLHWTAWAWYVNGCNFPSIISDWNGTPFGVVGALVLSYLGGVGGTAAPSTTGPITPATTTLTVYTDSLQNGFFDYSWSTNYSLSDTTHVHSGIYAIRFAVQAYGGLYFHSPVFITLGAYSTLQFYIYGTTTIVANSFALIIYDTSIDLVQIGNVIAFPTGVTAGTWTLVSVPVSSFGAPLSSLISGFAIQGNVPGNLGYVWIDDISFVPPTSSISTTGAASTTSTTGATTTPVNTSTVTTSVPTTTTTTTTTAPTTTTTTSTITTTSVPSTTSILTTITTSTITAPATTTTTTATLTTTTFAPTSTGTSTQATTAPPAPGTTTSPPATITTATPTTTTTSPPTTITTATPTTTTTSSPANPTQAPTCPPAASTTGPSGVAGCGASNIIISQTEESSWPAGTTTVTQFAVTIASTCANKTLVALSLSTTNWAAVGFWGGSLSGTTLILPSYATITTSSPFTGLGYQNTGGQATFTVSSFTFH